MEITLLLLNGPTWVRTRDLPVMSRWLYQLSYGPYDHYILSLQGVNPFPISECGLRLPAAGRDCGMPILILIPHSLRARRLCEPEAEIRI